MLKSKKLEDRRYFDENRIPPDVWKVLRAASLLSIGEFRVFEVAYREWHGEAGEEALIERHFTPYMFKDIVPPWVRHFCERVIRLDDEDALDPAAFGIRQPVPTRELQNRGLEYIMLIMVLLIGLFFLGESAAKVLQLQCMFPPCY